MLYGISSQQPRNPQYLKPVKQVIVPRHVIKYITRQGSGRTPQKGDQIAACMKCYTINGQQIANTENNVIRYFFGYNRLIPGLEIGLASVRVGEKCRLIISPEYAYGDQDKTTTLKANTKLIFELSIRTIGKKQSINMLSVQYFSIAIHELKLVDEALSRGAYDESHIHFQKAFNASDHVRHYNDNLKHNVGLKWARVLKYQNRLKQALEKTNWVLRTNPSWLKAYKFLKQLYIQMQEFSKLDERMKQMYKANEQNIKIVKFFVQYLRKYGKKYQLQQIPGYSFPRGDIIEKQFEQHIRKKREKEANKLKRLHMGFFQLRYF